MKLTLENGTELDVELVPLRVSQYPAAFVAQQQEDESKLMGMIIRPSDPNAPIAATIPPMLTPESYEAVAAAMPEVLRRFFAYCVRRTSGRVLVDSGLLKTAASAGASTSPNSLSPQG